MELNYKKILKDILIFDAHCDTADKLIEKSQVVYYVIAYLFL